MLQNPSVVLSLGNLTAGMDVNITLPYAAFDLTTKSPLVGTPTKVLLFEESDKFYAIYPRANILSRSLRDCRL